MKQNKYEVTYIVESNLGEEATTALIERFSESVKTNGGEVRQVKPWGKRRFAYELKGRREGLYVTTTSCAACLWSRTSSFAPSSKENSPDGYPREFPLFRGSFSSSLIGRVFKMPESGYSSGTHKRTRASVSKKTNVPNLRRDIGFFK
jgi:ribosomal protein S6